MASDLKPGAALLYRSGTERNFPIPGGPEVRVGYKRKNEIPVPFEGVSRLHAKISTDGKTYWVEDAGSANGTFLNGRRLTKKERLEHLDVLTLGRKAGLIFVRKKVDSPRVRRRGIVKAWLEMLNGPEAGTRREIPRGTISIGRSPSNNVVADSQLISKIHARLEQSGLQLVLTDLHSSNGTFSEQERIESKILQDGDEFDLGGGRSYRVHIQEGEIETRDVGFPSSLEAAINKTLPTDWKTRIEWSPEERAAFEDMRKGPAPIPAVEPAARPQKPSPVSGAASPARGPELEPSPAALRAAPAARPPAGVRPESAKAKEAPPAESPKISIPAPEPPPAAPARVVPAPPAVPDPSAATRAIPSLSVTAPRIFLEGQMKVFPLGLGTHEIGRLPASSIRLEGPQISRRHAVIRVTETEAILEDLGSSNGTFVNNRRITTPRALADGDSVNFGDMRFRLRFASVQPGRGDEK